MKNGVIICGLVLSLLSGCSSVPSAQDNARRNELAGQSKGESSKEGKQDQSESTEATDGESATTDKRLVLMPLRVSESDRRLQGSMEAALVKGLQSKYEVFSGERVAQKAKEIFSKESAEQKKDCDETRCMQDIAMAFQSELIAVATVTKQSDGYFLAISIQNIFDNKVIFSESMPCRNCDAYDVVDKLKELVEGQVKRVADTKINSGKQKNPVKEVFPDIEDFSHRPVSFTFGASSNNYNSPAKTGNITSSYIAARLGFAYATQSNFTLKLVASASPDFASPDPATWNAQDFGYTNPRKFSRQEGIISLTKKMDSIPIAVAASYSSIKTSLEYGDIVINGVLTPALDNTILTEYALGVRYTNVVLATDTLSNEYELSADLLFDTAKYTDYLGGIYNSKMGVGYGVGANYRHFFTRGFGFSIDADYKSRKIEYIPFSANETDLALMLSIISKF